MTENSVEALSGRILKEIYRIEHKLGEGGPSVVYYGTDLLMDLPVAIKQLKGGQDGGMIDPKRFLREARTQARLVHQNIVGIRAIIEEKDQLFIIMEYIEGQDLETKISRSESQPRVPLEEIRVIFRQALQGLSYAHRQGVIHRDIKPSNLMITPSLQVKIADFGIARQIEDQRLTKTGMLVGTPAYMSPEQLRTQNPDHRTDLYSLGISLYEALCGCTPFDRPDDKGLDIFQLISRQLMEPPPPLERWGLDLSVDLEPVLQKSLAKEPENRYQTCEEFLAALEEVFSPGAGAHVISQNLPTVEPEARQPSTPLPTGEQPPPSEPSQTKPPVEDEDEEDDEEDEEFSRKVAQTVREQPIPHTAVTPAVPKDAIEAIMNPPAQGGLRRSWERAAPLLKKTGHSLGKGSRRGAELLGQGGRWLWTHKEQRPVQIGAAVTSALLVFLLLFAFWPGGSSPPSNASPRDGGTAPDAAPGSTRIPAAPPPPGTRQLAGAGSPEKTPQTTETPPDAAAPSRDAPYAPGKALPSSIRWRELMVPIPAGCMESSRSSRRSRRRRRRRRRRRKICLKAFWIDRFEVTAGQYKKCVKAGGCKPLIQRTFFGRKINRSRRLEDHEPVRWTRWYDARSFCRWANKRLPTSKEWTYAAQGKEPRTYPWGDEKPNCRRALLRGCRRTPHQVGLNVRRAGRSPFGVYDMAGSVWEWIQNCYKRRCRYRTLRGGSWRSRRRNLRISSRRGGGRRHVDYGFRCAWSPSR